MNSRHCERAMRERADKHACGEVFIYTSTLHAPDMYRTNNAVHSRSLRKDSLNLGHSPAQGILGMFLNEMLLHLHLQLLTFHTYSDLWLDYFCSHRAVSHMSSTKKRSRHLADSPPEAVDDLGFAIVKVQFCRLEC